VLSGRDKSITTTPLHQLPSSLKEFYFFRVKYLSNKLKEFLQVVDSAGGLAYWLASLASVDQRWARLVLRWATESGSIPGARHFGM